MDFGVRYNGEASVVNLKTCILQKTNSKVYSGCYAIRNNREGGGQSRTLTGYIHIFKSHQCHWLIYSVHIQSVKNVRVSIK